MFEAIFSAANLGIIVIDRTGKILRVNPFAAQLFGYVQDELLSKQVEMLIPTKFRDNHLSHREYYLSNPTPRLMGAGRDLHGLRRDGSEFSIEISLSHTEIDSTPVVIAFISDITERVQTAASITTKSEAISSASMPICFADLNGFITYANSAFLKLWGFEKESDVIGISNSELGGSRDKVEEIMTALHTSGSWSGKDVAKKLDGTLFDVYLTSSLVKNDKGIPISTIATFMDITELKRTQQSLEEKTQTLRSSMQLAQLGSWHFDLSTKNILLDDQSKVIFNISADKEFVTYDEFVSLFQTEDQQDIIDKLQHAYATKGSCKKECAIIIGQDEIRWVSSEAQALVNRQGEVVKLMGVSLDITEQIQKEEKLREYSEQLEQKVITRTSELSESRNKLAEAQKKAKVAYVEFNLIDNTIQGSKQLYKILDLDTKDLITIEQYIQLIHPDDIARVQSKTVEAIKENLTLTIEYKVVTKKGKEKYIDSKTSKIVKNTEGKVIQRREIIQDITTLKIAELSMAETLKKEQELNQLKSRFVSMASHEFRTPLSSILSSTGLINIHGDRGSFDKQKKHIARIQSSVNNLTSILNDFLSIEKLESGQVHFETEKTNLHEFVDELKQALDSMTKEGQLILSEHSGEEEVYIDNHLVKNIMINLLSNAIKYSPNGEDVHLLTENTKEQLVIRVKDSGLGIPKEEQEQMFSRFFRATNVTTIQGTGLGLTIVKRYLDLMDGTISFISNPKEGTIFTIEIPHQ